MHLFLLFSLVVPFNEYHSSLDISENVQKSIHICGFLLFACAIYEIVLSPLVNLKLSRYCLAITRKPRARHSHLPKSPCLLLFVMITSHVMIDLDEQRRASCAMVASG